MAQLERDFRFRASAEKGVNAIPTVNDRSGETVSW